MTNTQTPTPDNEADESAKAQQPPAAAKTRTRKPRKTPAQAAGKSRGKKRTTSSKAPRARAANKEDQEEFRDDDVIIELDDTPVDGALLAEQIIDPKVISRGKQVQKQEELAQSEKLHKVLADAGLGSRRDMEELILQGRISVNAEPAHLGQRVMPGDVVRLNGRVVKRMAAGGGKAKTPRVLVYHKPAGEIVSMSDPQGRRTVFDNLPKISGARWIAVGRLDYNTEGLLLFTTSGDLANRLMHPRYRIEREYLVRAAGDMTPEAKQMLTTEVMLDDGPAAFSLLEEKGGDNLNRWYLVRISEGRNREVRRMFAAVGLLVSRLIRVRYGAVRLPADLPRGEKTELKSAWVQAWCAQLKADTPASSRSGKAKAQAGKKPSAKSHDKGKSAQGKRWQPDPMTSTVNYIQSGRLGAADHAYGKALAQSDRVDLPRGNYKPRQGRRR